MTATYGPYTQTSSLALTIGAAETITPVPLKTSDQMVRTDALTPYTSFPEPNYLIYHTATNCFFSTDAYLNQLNVVDAATNTLKATLDSPGAFGIDQAPDGSVIYVGTMAGDIYVVDPVGLTVTKRYPSSSISPYGFVANAVYALANGQLLLEKYFLVPGYSWVDGNGPLAMWNPANNNIVFFTTPGNINGQMPQEPSCLSGFENVILTNNRSRVLLVPVLTSEGSSLLCSFDPVADTWNWSAQISGGSSSAFATFAISADGSTLAAFDGYKIYNLDPATLNVKNSFAVPTTQLVLEYPVMFLSQDNSKVFITDEVETHALAGIHFELKKGEYLSIAGPSGCGKSTLLAILGLLDTPSDGVYYLNGKPVTGLKLSERARIRNREIGFIFQAFNLIGDLTVYENVELPLTYRGMPGSERKRRVQEALERVGMSHRMKHYPSQLSGGQQQRVAVARALGGDPLILLADEPTGNLDSANGEAVMSLLKELHSAGATVCMVTHDPRYAEFADRTIRLFDGRIVEEAQVEPAAKH